MIVLVLSYRHMNCANPTRSCCKFALKKAIMRADAIKHPRDILSNPRDKPKLLAHAIILLSNHIIKPTIILSFAFATRIEGSICYTRCEPMWSYAIPQRTGSIDSRATDDLSRQCISQLNSGTLAMNCQYSTHVRDRKGRRTRRRRLPSRVIIDAVAQPTT